jgi:hypothetical protein
MPFKNKEKQKEYLKKYRIQYRIDNLDKLKQDSKDWNNNNKDKHRESNSKWFQENRELTYSRYKVNRLKHIYGLTINEYNQMFVDQNGTCAICKKNQINGKNLSVDHDHQTSKVRGLLCNNCNSGLGFFKDNIENLTEAINYLNNN